MSLRQLPETGRRPDVPPPRARRRARVVLLSAATGVLLAVLWSFELVDKVIGDNVANTVLGHDAKGTAITGTAAGLLFAFVSGFAGTFTACNVAMAASVGPMSQASGTDATTAPLRALLRPVGWLALGMITVSASYGAIGVLLGDRLPQLSTADVDGMPVRLVQSSVVFGVIGLALIYLGLAALGLLPDVFARRPVGRVVTMGALVGGFLIGRPYPMFNKLFHWAADTGNPLYGALAFALQSLGNILLVTLIFGIVVMASRGRFLTWMADPRRAAVVTGALLVALGVFTVVYWDVRLPARFGIGWFPTMPYN
ncbi:hypothetical protein O7602_14895 [Micromonospora sp. WMMD1128]|uniref:hypothetical protein n=1 Tax=unclassified Micromonospora TaxID=2617518 RepID=UPI00248B57FF|nr:MULTISPECIES: hypothetical protein [unclassified Micromonospora]WBB76740.1 hypothetical protein O7602_14895 [Micromonospora sp. WMMD1128]WFE35475.1 hypothetical protein O7613_08875 [Micromonospora sp. WMMD975]